MYRYKSYIWPILVVALVIGALAMFGLSSAFADIYLPFVGSGDTEMVQSARVNDTPHYGPDNPPPVDAPRIEIPEEERDHRQEEIVKQLMLKEMENMTVRALTGPSTKGGKIYVAGEFIQLDNDTYVQHNIHSVTCAFNTPECLPGPHYILNRNGKTIGIKSRSGRVFVGPRMGDLAEAKEHFKELIEWIPGKGEGVPSEKWGYTGE